MLITMHCPVHHEILSGELRNVEVDGYINTYAIDTSEMWCQSDNDDPANQNDNCRDSWQTQITIDSH